MEYGNRHDLSPPAFWRSRHAVGLLVIGAVAACYLLTEHLPHVLGALPYLLILACPLTHLFMHLGHGRGAWPGAGFRSCRRRQRERS